MTAGRKRDPGGDVPRALDRMAGRPAAWLSGQGPRSSVVLSTRVRLARNLHGLPFGTRARDADRDAVIARTRQAAAAASGLQGGIYIDVGALGETDRRLLIERHLISRDLAGDEGARGVFVGPGEALSVLVNEEDHLRLQAILPGYQLEAAARAVDSLDTGLGATLGFAFSETLGFLTACPTNVGTGMRASVLVHLPALVLTKQIGKVLQGIAQVGLAVRGLHGEGTEVMGNFFQISNQATLGLSESQIVENLVRVTQQIIDHESAAADVLMRDARVEVEDKVFRAWGILRSCRVISSEEVMGLASAVRLGVHLGLIDAVPIPTLNHLLVLTQPAHLERVLERQAPAAARDQKRAEIVRGLLASPSEN